MFGLDPTSRFALKLRRWRSRLGIAAPRVAIRTELPWHWRALSVIVLSACSLALAGWIYNAGLRFAGFHIETSAQELTELRERVAKLTAELEQTSKIANASGSRLMIESTAQERLATQIKALEEENAQLKADLAMFENLVGNDQGPPGLEISRLQIVPEGTQGQHRFRLLIAQRGDVKDREFRGNLQLSVTLMRGTQTVIMEFPSSTEVNSAKYSVIVKRFGRLEGVFQVPEGASIQRVEARLLEGGVVKARSTVSQ